MQPISMSQINSFHAQQQLPVNQEGELTQEEIDRVSNCIGSAPDIALARIACRDQTVSVELLSRVFCLFKDEAIKQLEYEGIPQERILSALIDKGQDQMMQEIFDAHLETLQGAYILDFTQYITRPLGDERVFKALESLQNRVPLEEQLHSQMISLNQSTLNQRIANQKELSKSLWPAIAEKVYRAVYHAMGMAVPNWVTQDYFLKRFFEKKEIPSPEKEILPPDENPRYHLVRTILKGVQNQPVKRLQPYIQDLVENAFHGVLRISRTAISKNLKEQVCAKLLPSLQNEIETNYFIDLTRALDPIVKDEDLLVKDGVIDGKKVHTVSVRSECERLVFLALFHAEKDALNEFKAYRKAKLPYLCIEVAEELKRMDCHLPEDCFIPENYKAIIKK